MMSHSSAFGIGDEDFSELMPRTCKMAISAPSRRVRMAWISSGVWMAAMSPYLRTHGRGLRPSTTL